MIIIFIIPTSFIIFIKHIHLFIFLIISLINLILVQSFLNYHDLNSFIIMFFLFIITLNLSMLLYYLILLFIIIIIKTIIIIINANYSNYPNLFINLHFILLNFKFLSIINHIIIIIFFFLLIILSNHIIIIILFFYIILSHYSISLYLIKDLILFFH